MQIQRKALSYKPVGQFVLTLIGVLDCLHAILFLILAVVF